MNTTPQKWISFPPDWTWVSVGFCYFVIGHLFPMSIISWPSTPHSWLQVLASAWGFGGLAVIAFIIGFKSRNVAVVEAVIACLLYTAIFNVAMSNIWTNSLRITGALWMILAFVTSVVSSVLGEIIQHMKEMKETN